MTKIAFTSLGTLGVVTILALPAFAPLQMGCQGVLQLAGERFLSSPKDAAGL